MKRHVQRHVQRYVVLLRETPTQLWLAYNDFGRIGNATRYMAWEFDTEAEAKSALARVRRTHNWPQGKIMGVLVEVDDG